MTSVHDHRWQVLIKWHQGHGQHQWHQKSNSIYQLTELNMKGIDITFPQMTFLKLLFKIKQQTKLWVLDPTLVRPLPGLTYEFFF